MSQYRASAWSRSLSLMCRRVAARMDWRIVNRLSHLGLEGASHENASRHSSSPRGKRLKRKGHKLTRKSCPLILMRSCVWILPMALLPWTNHVAAGSEFLRGWKSCTVIGTPGDDPSLLGSPGRDVICGRGGDDKIKGLGGHDLIRGGEGDDILIGGEGDDRIVGGRGEDQAYGRDGVDQMLGGRGDDILEADDGSDVAHGGPGADSLYGTDGEDVLRGGAGNEHCIWARDGEAGDAVFGGPGRDRGRADSSDSEDSVELHPACWG